MKIQKYIKKNSAPIVYIAVMILVLLVFIPVIFKPVELDPISTQFPDDNPELNPRDVEEVSEEPVPEDFEWQGASTDPKYISIPAINTQGFIENNGVNAKNEIAVPKNVYKAGWFEQSALPGQKGLSIISGHLNGPSRNTDGIFANLDQLKSGQQFTVEIGNGQILNYEVVKVNTYEYNEAAQYLFSQKPTIPSQLNLITCAGEFSDEVRTFDERTIVIAKLLE